MCATLVAVFAVTTERQPELVGLLGVLGAAGLAAIVVERLVDGRFPWQREPWWVGKPFWRTAAVVAVGLPSYIAAEVVLRPAGVVEVGVFLGTMYLGYAAAILLPAPARDSIPDRFLRACFRVYSLINEGRGLSPEEAASPSPPAGPKSGDIG